MQPELYGIILVATIVIYLGVALLPGLFLGGLISFFAKSGQAAVLAALICAPVCALLYCYFIGKQPELFRLFKAAAMALTVTTLFGVWLGLKIKRSL